MIVDLINFLDFHFLEGILIRGNMDLITDDVCFNGLSDAILNVTADSISSVNDEWKKVDHLGLSILMINARSIRDLSRFDDFRSQLSLLRARPSVIVVTETWIEQESIDLYRIAGYFAVNCCRLSRTGGGVAMYINQEISFSNPTVDLKRGIECVEVTLRLISGPFVVQAYYRPPNVDFCDLIDTLNDGLRAGRNNCVALGDFNVDLLAQSRRRNHYLDHIETLGFVVMNNVVTRPSSGTLIDHVLKNFQSESVNITFELGIRTDHNAILSLFDLEVSPVVKGRKIVRTNWNDFTSRIEQSLSNVQFDDPNTMCDFITSEVNSAMSESTTTRHLPAIIDDCDWMSIELQRLVRRKDNFKRAMRRYPLSAFHKTRYDDICQIVTDMKKRDRLNNCEREFGQNVSPKQKWRNLNKLLGRNCRPKISAIIKGNDVIDDETEMAEEFNEYFVNAPIELSPPAHRDLNINSFDTMTPQVDSFFLEPATNDEITRRIEKLSDEKSPGLDGITARSVKIGTNTLSPLMTDMINLSFATGIVPDKMKVARVTPVFKSGSRNRKENHRPISVLPTFDKVFEGCLNDRLVAFWNATGFFHGTQYGFRARSSTTGACLELTEDILRASDERKFVGVTFFDSSKAFDLVPHDLLLAKLENAGIRGLPNRLIRSYLQDRSQCVSINGKVSSCRHVELGVPQGSKLGPTFYIAYTNDLGKLGLNGKIMMYADDISIFYEDDSAQSLRDKMCLDMDLLSDWFRANRLVLNLDKSKVMYFGRAASSELSQDITIGGQVVQRVDTFRYLGLILDSNLSFRAHVEHVSRKLAGIVGMFWRVRALVPRHFLINMYFSFFHSNLSYMLEVYGSCNKSVLERLEKLQRRILKIIFNLPRMFPTRELYERVRQYNIFPVKLNYFVTAATFAKKIVNGITHCNLSILPDLPSRRTRHTNSYRLPRVRTELGRRRFLYVAKMIGNSLDDAFSPSMSLASFKRSVRSFLRDDESIFEKLLRADKWY